MNDADQKQTINDIIKIVLKEGPDYPYHDKDHIIHMYEATQLYANRARLSDDEKFLLGTAALFHDIIFQPGDDKNESYSAQYAANYMKDKGFSSTHIKIVENIIIATHMPTHPRTELEKLMCDADVDYLGTDNFFLFRDRLRKEWNIADDEKWWRLQIRFLEGHKYYSDIAKKLRDKKKTDNLEKVKSILADLKK